LVILDHQAVRQRSFLRGVAIAAGRASPEVFTDSLEEPIVEPGTMPLTVAEARDAGKLILVAEDDEINQKVILRQLELLGHAAEVAATGAEALAMWRRGRYALLITDLHMPEMDGYELATTIRRLEPTGSRVPIIALTANALRGEALRAKEVGMDAYLTKPIRLKELKHALNHALATIEGREGAEAEPETASVSVSQPLHRSGEMVDVEVLKRYIGDDAEAISEFLTEFRKSVRHHAADLHKGVTSRDVSQVSMSAHTLKSTSRAAGALAFSDALAEMESAAKRHDIEAIDRYYLEFQRLLPLVMERLDVLVPPP
jgi:CheY-like chemotaxis protein/HPt (histidine-containing phosphotransfer) domain-containing protein